MNGLLSIVVPEPIQFFNWGWWIIHVIGISTVFLVGAACGRRCARKTCASQQPPAAP
jgi:hypothetical protein